MLNPWYRPPTVGAWDEAASKDQPSGRWLGAKESYTYVIKMRCEKRAVSRKITRDKLSLVEGVPAAAWSLAHGGRCHHSSPGLQGLCEHCSVMPAVKLCQCLSSSSYNDQLHVNPASWLFILFWRARPWETGIAAWMLILEHPGP